MYATCICQWMWANSVKLSTSLSLMLFLFKCLPKYQQQEGSLPLHIVSLSHSKSSSGYMLHLDQWQKYVFVHDSPENDHFVQYLIHFSYF